MPANPEILSAIGTTEGTAQRFGVFNRRSAIPAHTYIILLKARTTQDKKNTL
jgi:hypothetical protein